MMRRPILVAAGVLAAVGAWYLFRPELLFIDRTVDEALALPASAPAATAAPTVALREPAVPVEPASAERAVLLRGDFHSNAHETRGTATIHAVDGRRVLRLAGFSTSNGPDVRVLLVAASDVNDEAAAKRAGWVELGRLKGNVGDQNYEVPASVDLARYRTVTIWCQRFSVNFGSAPLRSPT